jgi:glycosyltransferase involved in cell wall biosynthesis
VIIGEKKMIYTNNDHTFIVCAYKENLYLEECVKSVVSQTINSNVLISTSTPNDFIYNVAKKYDLDVVINKGIGDITDNFNFAYSQVNTELITICHQDDYYANDYLENVLKYLNKSKDPLICFTDYYELREEQIIKSNSLLKTKRVLLSPLRISLFWGNKFIRRRILSFGNPICCPSVTFVKSRIHNPNFNGLYRATFDWRVWEKISKFNGDFIFCPKPLLYRRIHKESTTTETILNNARTVQDQEIFQLFWPKWIAVKLAKLYDSGCQKNNNI